MSKPISIWECEGLSKSYGIGAFQLDNVDLKINPGEITGVVGENGNGKTTLLRIIAGDLAADSGDIKYMGREIGPNDWRSYKEEITYIPQRIPKWYGFLKTNLEFQASIMGIKGKEIDRRLNTLLEELGLTEYAHLKWSEISTGYRLRFQLAKMLIGKPSLLVLDEPIANLDIKAQEKFLVDLKKLVATDEFNTAVILSSQQLHEVEAFADNIVFIQKGEVKYSGKVEEVGNDRTENVFEISGSMSEEDIKAISSDIKSITTQGKNWVISCEVGLTPEQFLESLLKNGAKITYFRDISSSTKKMFG